MVSRLLVASWFPLLDQPIRFWLAIKGERGRYTGALTHFPALSAQRFMERCRPAIQREIGRRPGENIERLVGELLDPTLWRAFLLNSALPISDKEFDEIVPLLAECLGKIFRPWLENQSSTRLARQR